MDQSKKTLLEYQSNKSIFERNSSFSVFLNKKTEKIAAAVYLLTDFIHSTDPLRTELRSVVLELLAESLSNDERSGEKMIRLMRKLNSLLEVGHSANLISDMNSGVFKKELDTLLALVESRFRPSAELIFQDAFFEAALPEAAAVPESGYKGQLIKDNKGHSANSGLAQGTEGNKRQYSTPQRKESREAVLNYFKKTKKADVSIKDISAVVKDCSEKTIQRELIRLVSQGLVRKDGERRWSKYSLIS